MPAQGAKWACCATLFVLAVLSACSREAGPVLSALGQQGRGVYLNACIACHNADPRHHGSVGPEVAGASRELLEARVLHAAYPPGYLPKRTSNVMPAYPHLVGQIDALATYLDEAAAPRLPAGSAAAPPAEAPPPEAAARGSDQHFVE